MNFNHSSGVLTKKQAWRRQPTTSTRRRDHNFLYYQGFSLDSGVNRRSWSEQTMGSTPLLNSHAKQWGTTGDLLDAKRDLTTGRKIKSVMFSARVNVILIPSITEYENAGLATIIWWSDDDYVKFKREAMEEVRGFMRSEGMKNSKEAIKLMYSPFRMAEELLAATASSTTSTTTITINTSSSSSSGKHPANVSDDEKVKAGKAVSLQQQSFNNNHKNKNKNKNSNNKEDELEEDDLIILSCSPRTDIELLQMAAMAANNNPNNNTTIASNSHQTMLQLRSTSHLLPVLASLHQSSSSSEENSSNSNHSSSTMTIPTGIAGGTMTIPTVHPLALICL